MDVSTLCFTQHLLLSMFYCEDCDSSAPLFTESKCSSPGYAGGTGRRHCPSPLTHALPALPAQLHSRGHPQLGRAVKTATASGIFSSILQEELAGYKGSQHAGFQHCKSVSLVWKWLIAIWLDLLLAWLLCHRTAHLWLPSRLDHCESEFVNPKWTELSWTMSCLSFWILSLYSLFRENPLLPWIKRDLFFFIQPVSVSV